MSHNWKHDSGLHSNKFPMETISINLFVRVHFQLSESFNSQFCYTSVSTGSQSVKQMKRGARVSSTFDLLCENKVCDVMGKGTQAIRFTHLIFYDFNECVAHVPLTYFRNGVTDCGNFAGLLHFDVFKS